MLIRRLMWLPPVVQSAAVAVFLWGRPPYGLYAQLVSLFVMLIVLGAFGIQRFRLFRSNYKEIQRRRAEHATAFRGFVDANLPPTTRR